MIPRPLLSNRFVRSTLVCLVLLVSAGSFASFTAAWPAQAGLSSLVSQAPGSPNGLVINEVYDSQTPANEYFELYNTSQVAINLSTYVIYNRDGSNPLSRLADPTIAAGQYRAIGPAQLGTPTIAGSGIARIDFLGIVNTSPSDTVIDVVNFGGSPNPNWPNYDRFQQYFFTSNIPNLPAADGAQSLQRWPDGLDTDSGTDFRSINSSPGAPSCADPYEADDSQGQANTQAAGTVTLHRICPANDQDWTSIAMSASSSYTIQVTAQGALVDTVLSLYNASGALLLQSNDPNSRNSTLTYSPSSSGTFYAQVTDVNNAGAAGPDYLYTIAITATVGTPTPITPTPVGCADPYEPDDSRQTAKPIDLNTEQIHTLCPVGDQDWVVFSAVAGKVYTMYTKDLAGPVDTVITLYDGNGRFLAENDDYQPGQGLYSRIDYVFNATGVYYLRTRDKRNSGGIGYQYTLGLQSTGELPPTATASPTATFNPNTPTPTVGPCYDQLEPDGVAESASLILIGQTQLHSICPTGDADWVRFFAAAGKVYTIRTSNLGIGLDTYMYLFDTDGKTVIAENDDGGDGVSSRIDFYPQRDAFYFLQVKDKGDLGGPGFTYDLSLAVVPGVPQPPGTATAIIAPPVTVTSGLPTPQKPTPKPLNTPTQGVIPPTPAAVENTAVPPPVATKPVVTLVPTRSPTEEPTQFVPGVPSTGNAGTGTTIDTTSGSPAQAPPVVLNINPPPAAPQFAQLLFRLFYDKARNDTYQPGEGIRGVDVYFLNQDGSPVPNSSLLTNADGAGSAKLPATSLRLYIPYLGINMPLSKFPERAQHSLWLPPAPLPNSVP